jgi:hypothetical protein
MKFKLFITAFLMMHIGTIIVFLLLGHFKVFFGVFRISQIIGLIIPCFILVYLILPTLQKMASKLKVRNLPMFYIFWTLSLLTILEWYFIFETAHAPRRLDVPTLVYIFTSNFTTVVVAVLFDRKINYSNK